MFNWVVALGHVERVMAGAGLLFEVLAHVAHRGEGIAVAMLMAVLAVRHGLQAAQWVLRRTGRV